MTLDEVKEYFGTSYSFHKTTGMAHINYRNWRVRGYIPFETQYKLEQFTKGALKADFKDGSAKNVK